MSHSNLNSHIQAALFKIAKTGKKNLSVHQWKWIKKLEYIATQWCIMYAERRRKPYLLQQYE